MSAPLQRTASYQSSIRSSSNGGGAGDAEQLGRSTTSLNAEREAAAHALRGKAAPGQVQSEAGTAVMREQEQEQEQEQEHGRASRGSQSPDSVLEFDFAISPQASQQQQSMSPYSPVVSSPLNPTSSTSIHSSSGSGSSQEQPHSGDLAQVAADRPKTAGTAHPGPRPIPRPSLRVHQYGSVPDLRTQSLRTPSDPVKLQDLGADYTRYFNPFSDSAASPSARSSFSLKRSTSALALLAANTLSGRNTPPRSGADSPNPFLTPNASTTRVNMMYDTEKNLSYVSDRLTAPYETKGMAGWPLIDDPEEPDDEMHMPRADDDIKYRPKLSDHFTKDSIVSTIGLAVMIFGLLFVFIGLPVLSALGWP